MKVGYIRTSKKDQNPELQRRDLLAAGCEKIFEEQISSRKADRPEFRAAMDFCRESDEFVVWKLDRLDRSRNGKTRECRNAGSLASRARREAPSCGFVGLVRRSESCSGLLISSVGAISISLLLDLSQGR